MKVARHPCRLELVVVGVATLIEVEVGVEVAEVKEAEEEAFQKGNNRQLQDVGWSKMKKTTMMTKIVMSLPLRASQAMMNSRKTTSRSA